MSPVYSKYKFFGGFGLLLGLNVLAGFLVYMLLFASKKTIFNVDLINDSAARNAYLFVIGLQALMLVFFATQARYIIADREKITFINPLLPFVRKTRRWSDFDYFVVVMEESRGGSHEAVWLVKNRRLAARFSSFYYSNYRDLANQVKTKSKGYGNFNIFEQLFILLGMMKIRN